IKKMQKRNFEGFYFDSAKEAVDAIVHLIPAGSLIGLGGSETVIETGLVEVLRKMKITLLDRYADGVSRERIDEMRREGLLSDIYIAGCNAIIEDGRLVNMDGMGNRVAAMAYGPKKVILMAGVNKIVTSLDQAIDRIKNVAAPMDAVRVGVKSPCATLGSCNEPHCHPPHRICSSLSIMEASWFQGRITVILVGESLGY
ncbi:MAG: lactate utilization protein, partial [Planctomycetota bacterium]